MARSAERLECPACGNATRPDTARERIAAEWNEAGWCGQAATPQPYVPFGPEWERAMMLKHKTELVSLAKHACQEKEALRATVRRLQARLNRTELEEVVARLTQRGLIMRPSAGSVRSAMGNGQSATGKAVEA